MKKVTFLSILLLFFSMADSSQGANKTLLNSNETIAKTQFLGGGKKNKNGQYRRKKGFLWGLFKGKNACDCPKH